MITKAKHVGSGMVTNNKFTREVFSIDGTVTSFRFRTVNHIAMFSKVLGNTSRIGTRNMKPKLNCTDFVSNGNVINVIGGIHKVDDTSKYGIDILCKVNSYNHHQLFINVRYQKVKFQSPWFTRFDFFKNTIDDMDLNYMNVNDIVCSTNTIDTNDTIMHNTDSIIIKINALLNIDGDLYSVNNVDDNEVTLDLQWPLEKKPFQRIETDFKFVAQQIKIRAGEEVVID